MTFFQYIRLLARYLAPYRGTAAGVGLLLILDVAFSILWPLSLKYFIDKITDGIDLFFFSKIVAALIAAVVLASVADFLRGYCFALLSSKIKRDARQAVFGHLQKLSMSFFLQQRTRDLIARLSGDLSLLESAVTSGVAGFLLGAVGIVLSATILFFLEWRLAVLTACGLAFCVVLPRPLIRITSSMPAATASCTISCSVGVSTMGSISLGMALVAGRNLVPSPATGRTALVIDRAPCI